LNRAGFFGHTHVAGCVMRWTVSGGAGGARELPGRTKE
jgi:hypothetical protein